MSNSSTPNTPARQTQKHPMEIASEKGRRDFNNASNSEREKRRESFMVKRQKPKPVLRPAPHIANGPDRAAFNRQWTDEQKSAAPKTEQTKQDRKAAFMAARKNTSTTKSQTRSK